MWTFVIDIFKIVDLFNSKNEPILSKLVSIVGFSFIILIVVNFLVRQLPDLFLWPYIIHLHIHMLHTDSPLLCIYWEDTACQGDREQHTCDHKDFSYYCTVAGKPPHQTDRCLYDKYADTCAWNKEAPFHTANHTTHQPYDKVCFFSTKRINNQYIGTYVIKYVVILSEW